MEMIRKTETTLERLKRLVSGDDAQKRFNEVLGKKAPLFVASLTSMVSGNKAFDGCEVSSIVTAAMQAATLDLPINPSLGYAHVIPYNMSVKTQEGWTKQKVAQFQIGYKGLLQLCQRSGQYAAINVAVVYDGEIKSYNRFTGAFEFGERASDQVVGYMAYFKLIGGFEKFHYMTVEEVTKHAMRYSKMIKDGKLTGVWSDNFDAMACKTVLKALLKTYGIQSIEITRAIETDQAMITESGEAVYVDNPHEDEAPAVVEAKIVSEQHDVNADRIQMKPITIAQPDAKPEPAPEPQNGNGKKQKKVSTPPPVKETQEAAKDFSELTVENCDEVLKTIAGIGTQAELNAWKKRNMIKFSGTQHAYLYDAVEEAVLNRTWELEEA